MRSRIPRLLRRALLVAPLIGLAPLGLSQVPISGPLSDDTTGPLLSGTVYHAIGNVWVEAGKTLTAQAGAVVKFQAGSAFLSYGTLRAQGTSIAPVVFTDLRDDTAGGDTNGDGGATVPGRGWWTTLAFPAGSAASTLEWLELRYAGYNYTPAIACDGAASLSLSHVAVLETYADGLDLAGSLGVSATACRFEGSNLGVAVDRAPISAVPQFRDNTASGYPGNYMRVTDGTVGVPALKITTQNVLGGALVLAGNLLVPNGRKLTLGRGVVLKPESAYWILVHGTLVTQGLESAPVVFTDLRDDTAGGDTNGDGAASAPARGWWLGLVLYSDSSGTLCNGLDLRYGGYNYVAGLTCEAGAQGALQGSRIQSCYADGMDLQGAAAGVTVTGCSFEDNGSVAVDRVPIDAVPGFSGNSAHGNGGNYLRVTNPVVGAAPLVIEPDQLLGGALVLADSLVVPSGSSLRLEPGVVLKMTSAYWVQVHGTLVTAGTEDEPVVLTELRDDAAGGDTNGDGAASAPQKGQWLGLVAYADATACSLRGLTVRYSGYSYVAGVYAEAGAGLALDQVRVEHGYASGFELYGHAGDARRLVAWDCGGRGLYLRGGSFTVRQASSVGNTVGFQASGWTGGVTDSIGWSNGTNFQGFTAGHLRYSDGDPALAGTDGNIDLDPRFVAESAGDFRLLPASPCVDAGDPQSPADPDGTRADMGAYPRSACGARTYCQGKPNSLGCLPALEFSGSASLTSSEPFLITARNLINNQFGIFYYGINGPAHTPFQGGTLCVNPPLVRMPVQNSGGNPPPADCSGVITVDFNDWLQGGHDSSLVLGTVVYAQCWSRDPKNPPYPTALTDGITFRICP